MHWISGSLGLARACTESSEGSVIQLHGFGEVISCSEDAGKIPDAMLMRSLCMLQVTSASFHLGMNTPHVGLPLPPVLKYHIFSAGQETNRLTSKSLHISCRVLWL